MKFSSVPEHAATHCQGLHSDYNETHKTVHAHCEISQHPWRDSKSGDWKIAILAHQEDIILL